MDVLMRDMNADEWGIKSLQNCILNIMMYIHDFCEKYNIEYTLAYGSVLGAVRHKGFIPWDDDMDIFMTPDNYEKFSKTFQEYGDHKNFYLQESGKVNGIASFSKLKMNNTYIHEELSENMDVHHGIFVDIFQLHNVPDDEKAKRKFVFWCRYRAFLASIRYDYKRRGTLVRISVSILRTLIPKRFLLKHAYNQIYKYRNQQCDCKACIDGFFENAKTGIHSSKIFTDRKLVDFEKIKLYIPAGYDEYLRHQYGDYMKMPSLKQIKFGQHSMEYWVDKPFVPRKGGTYADVW
jgi:lipopolysaccharide cholinephosphotransferase